MKETASGHLAVGIFGHTSTITTFFTLIGLYNDNEHLMADSFVRQANRKFRQSTCGPMAANFVFVLSNCGSGHVVEAFVNEEPTLIPGCEDLN